MANIANFIGTEWKQGASLDVAWQLMSSGSMSSCGTVDQIQVTDTSTTFVVNVDVPALGPMNAQITIALDNDDPSRTSGNYTITIDGGPSQQGQFSEGPAHNPGDFPGGNAIFLHKATYKSHTFTLQIWPVDNKTLLYLDISGLLPSIWLCFGHR
ncbi:hypothetical protein [Burkholderia gladioli]|uniref:hypothetical protein n=1 Tax=Burkholderia gladioli TaxID=28095 RepID=UPI00163E0962|nr:hypothetical protein [Burkholderia gladioli]MBW5286765.1 hypothetical protein [Burkholderia gladioli]